MKFKTNEGIEKRNNNFMHRLFYRTPESTYELHGDLKKSIGYNFDYPDAYADMIQRDTLYYHMKKAKEDLYSNLFETPERRDVKKITVYTRPRCYQKTLIYIID